VSKECSCSFIPHPIFIIVFVVVAVGIRGGVNDVLREHQFRFINLKVSEVLTVVGLGCCLLFFIVLPFSAITILVSNFVTVTAGVGGAIA
jgi:hypothetical protein